MWAWLACAETAYTPVDRMVDIDAEAPLEATRARVCVAEGPSLEAAFTDGRWAIAGVPNDITPIVTVDVTDDDGHRWRAGPVAVDANTVTVTLEPCDNCDECTASGRVVPRREPSWVIGVRFLSR